MGHRTLRSRIRYPRRRNARTAASSPIAPSCLRLTTSKLYGDSGKVALARLSHLVCPIRNRQSAIFLGTSSSGTEVVSSEQVIPMRPVCCAVAFLVLLAGTAVARVGDPLSGFSTGALMQQLQLTPSSQTADAAGRQIYRYVSDDEVITVDVVARGGLIEQQLMYVPMDPRRAFQVSFFLQDAVGSVVGAQKGMIAFNAALSNHKETYLPFGGFTMRLTPMGGLVRVLVTGS